MIIVSQNKEIINFDNVTRIFIEDFTEDGDGFGIGADTNSAESQCWDLGYYKTKERVEEVVQEIFIAYGNTEMLKMPKLQINEFISGKELIRNIVYMMPEE